MAVSVLAVIDVIIRDHDPQAMTENVHQNRKCCADMFQSGAVTDTTNSAMN